VYEDPSWFYTDPGFNMTNENPTFDDIKAADAEWAPVLDAINPDLRPFEKRGGKITQWQGWKDQNIPPLGLVNYL
jgi:feruloyl esterase